MVIFKRIAVVREDFGLNNMRNKILKVNTIVYGNLKY